jgi:mannose-6-phosphate isomerase-like protein (cupin superfamily)
MELPSDIYMRHWFLEAAEEDGAIRNHYPPNSTETNIMFHHEEEELLHLLQGKIDVFYGEKKYCLRARDCVYFNSGIHHRSESVGSKPAKVLAVIYQ